MITSIGIKNFKCFSHLRLPLGKLTLLTGFNAGGKSSAVQPLLLIAQGLRRNLETEEFALNGDLVRLGSAADIMPPDAVSPFVEILVEASRGSVRWSLEARALDRQLRQHPASAASGSTQDESNDTTASIRKTIAALTFISAVREGVSDTYPYPDEVDARVPDVGILGEFAPFIFGMRADDIVPVQRRQTAETGTTLRKQVAAWIGTLFPHAQANVRLLPDVSLANLQFRTSDLGAWRRPVNVGYGFTYAFPIVVALLTAIEGQIVVVDSPEAHLHPAAQSVMGQLLVQFAKAGVQIIVETHSDHLLNGVRLALRAGMMDATETYVHFFTGARNGAHGVVSPTINAAGALSEWPAGFFDQSERDLALLSGWD